MRLKYRLLGICLCLLSVAPAHAQSLNVSRLRLKNGLTVLAWEDHTVPSVAFYTVYKVGSRNERPGITGLSHLFEHMMFNGSARFKPKAFDELIEAGGGYSNAFTNADTTEYFEEFSSATLDTVLQLEADRMRALKLDKENLEQERGIVKEERRVSVDDSVEGSMTELLWNSAFVAHPYRWDPIGFMKDLDAVRLEDAKAYFRTYYAPNNAVVAVVGDFHTKELFAKMQKYFGGIPRQPPPRPVVNAEPPQRGERRIAFHRAAELPAVMMGYHVGTFRDADDPALDMLSLILSHGESSRLYRRLIYEKQIATHVDASNESRLDPGLFTFYAQAQSGHTAAECEAEIDAAMEDVQKNGVTERELQKAKNVFRFSYVNRFKTNNGRAGLLAEYEANWGDWRQLLNDLPRHERVTAADVQRVAKKYFSKRNRTVVTLHPEKGGEEELAHRRGGARAYGRGQVGRATLAYLSPSHLTPSPPLGSSNVQLPPVTRTTWENGVRVVLMEYRRAPTLEVLALFPGGSSVDPPGKAGAAALTAQLLRRGTEQRTALQIAEEIEFLGGTLGSGADDDRLTISLSVLSKDADAGLDLFADVIRHSTFPTEELERERQLHLSSLQSLSEHPGAVVSRVAAEVVYAGHPYGVMPTVTSLRAVTREDLLTYARHFIVPNRLILVAVGDFKTADMMSKLRARFGDWQRRESEAPAELPSPRPNPRRVVLIDKPDATQTHVQWTRLAFPRQHPDYFAAHIAETILGGSFTSRLTEEIRVNRSLTYDVSSRFDLQLRGGDFSVSTFTKIETTRALMDATNAVLRRTAEQGFTAAELKKVKGYLSGLFAIHIQTPEALAGEWADVAFYGLSDDYLQTYLSKLRAVTLADANRIARAYCQPEQLSLVLLAPAAKIKEQLKDVGDVETRAVETVGK